MVQALMWALSERFNSPMMRFWNGHPSVLASPEAFDLLHLRMSPLTQAGLTPEWTCPSFNFIGGRGSRNWYAMWSSHGQVSFLKPLKAESSWNTSPTSRVLLYPVASANYRIKFQVHVVFANHRFFRVLLSFTLASVYKTVSSLNTFD